MTIDKELTMKIHRFIIQTLFLLGLWLGVGLQAQAQTGTVTYIYTDQQGTPLAEADVNGNITATFDYAPYGSQALGTAPNGPGYTGHVNDPDTGLVYMQARYYDPATGRFLSTDPIGPAPSDAFNFNRYAYANNNPIINTDPTGAACAAASNSDSSCPAVSPPTPTPTPPPKSSVTNLPAVTVTEKAEHGMVATTGNHSMFSLGSVDSSEWGFAGRISQGQNIVIRSTGGIVVQPYTNSGPLPTQVVGFTIFNYQVDNNGKRIPLDGTPESLKPEYYSTGLKSNGAKSGYQFEATPGPGGNEWHIGYPGTDDFQQNAGDADLTIYTPLTK